MEWHAGIQLLGACSTQECTGRQVAVTWQERLGWKTGRHRQRLALQQPEVYMGHVASLLDEESKFSNEDTRKFLSGFLVRVAAGLKPIIGEHVL